MYKEVENFITAAECKDLITLCGQLEEEPSGYMTDHRILPSGELDMDIHRDEKILKATYHQLPNDHPINQRLWITGCDWAEENNYSMSCSSGSAIQKYESGGHFAWHTDGFNEADRFTLSIQLSDSNDYEGCEVQFGEDTTGANRTTSQDIYHDWELTQKSVKSVHTLSRNVGAMSLYDAFIYHRVTPLTKGTRYVLLHWFRDYPEHKEDKITWSDG